MRGTLGPLFGGADWEDDLATLIDAGMTREDAVVETYRQRFKAAEVFPYATTTRILNPLADRTFFYLVYGTRHWKGLYEFRSVEKKVVDTQELVRDTAKIDGRVASSGQTELFRPGEIQSTSLDFQEERSRQRAACLSSIRERLSKSASIKYEDLLPIALEHRLVWVSDFNTWLMDMKSKGEIEIDGLSPRERTPKPGHIIHRSARKTSS